MNQPAPHSKSSLPLSRQERADAVCDQFEQQWHSGQHPRIEDFLEQAFAEDRDHLLAELIALELELRLRADENPRRQDYRDRFPAATKLVDDAIAAAARKHAPPKLSSTLKYSAGEAQTSAQSPPPDKPEQPPQKIGRFAIERVLGRGGFAVVYLAHDAELDRPVALKVPRADRFDSEDDLEQFIREARSAAQLDHPGIVRVYDVQRVAGSVCIVQQYVEGRDLQAYIEAERPSPQRIAELLLDVAQAVQYAHERGFVHRDLKPANILLDKEGQPHLADFGLALHESVQWQHAWQRAGTPAYMSPEQVRGESHRLDGRSDIWSLGVILFEMLTGQRPFQGKGMDELSEAVQHRDPPPPAQLDPNLPAELSRICLACLAKRASDRYQRAIELIDDLRYWLRPKPPVAGAAKDAGSAPRPIVPKGLRSFDAADADFFLQLLPGPHDREGLPKGIRFWKTRIEQTDPGQTFTVGLMYGPSGCGKSSLVKAGLLPRLSREVAAVYIEATAADTEVRLLKALRQQCPELPADAALHELIAHLRTGGGSRGRKVLLVIDQFEQWLHAHAAGEEDQLVAALRQCDGRHVQCLLLVRDDFWMSLSRFMQSLEVPLVEGFNCAAVDLFELDHARRVLAAYGRAYGKLPTSPAEQPADQNRFLEEAVRGLAQDGQVISVRLALFAQMMQGRPWTAVSLWEMGGTEGVGVAFLEETFCDASSPVEHRRHQQAARAVLAALLPEQGTEIKGRMRSAARLRELSGYAHEPAQFAALLAILDRQLRLITPTEPDETAAASAEQGSADQAQYFQLTHDYLVPSLCRWLTRKQQETRRGRAELRLAQRAELWNSKPENRHLPSLWEFLSIRLLTSAGGWNPSQRKMMRLAMRLHAVRSAATAAMLLVAALVGLGIYRAVDEHNDATRAQERVAALISADIAQVPALVEELAPYRRHADPLLREQHAQADDDSDQRLHAALALVQVNPDHVDELHQRLLTVSPRQFPVVGDALHPHRATLIGPLWTTAQNAAAPLPRRFQAACALAGYAADDPRWRNVGMMVARHLVSLQAAEFIPWREALRPSHRQITTPLAAIFRDPGRPEPHRAYATQTLTDYLADQPAELFDLLADADQPQFAMLFDALAWHRDEAISLAEGELAERENPFATAEEKEDAQLVLDRRRANAAVALLRWGAAENVWPLLAHSPDPQLRSYIIHRYPLFGGEPAGLIDRLAVEPDISTRRALVLCLGDFSTDQLPAAERQRLIDELNQTYQTHPDPGLHGAIQWTLKQWQVPLPELPAAEPEDAGDQLSGRWYLTSQGQTIVILDGGEFLMGSPESEPDRRDEEDRHRRRIGRRFAIAAHEVTKAQWRRFAQAHTGVFSADNSSVAPYVTTDDSPMTAMTWFEAAWYCNWLSEQEGIPADQWCYQPNDAGSYAAGMKAREGFLTLAGYRLPTEAEWEFACRAGSSASRYYGADAELLPRYAWFIENSQDRTWPVGSLRPNDHGLFNMQGNVWNWCHDPYRAYPTSGGLGDLRRGNTGAVEDTAQSGAIEANASRVLRGGSFNVNARVVRSAYRLTYRPAFRNFHLGFRVARTYP